MPAPKAGAKKNTLGGVFFFALAPCRRPTKLLLPLPLAPGPEQKKKHPGWCFFFCSGPVPAPKAGAKKKTPWVVFLFCSGPVPAPNGASPSPAFPRGRSKKKNTLGGVFFFALAPPRRPTDFSFPCLSPGPEQKKNTLGGVFFFALAPCRRPRPEQKKNTLGGVFFFALAPCRRPTRLLLPLPFPGAGAKKKNTLGGVFFFALAPPRRPTERNKKKNTLHTRADSKKFSRNP